MKKLLTFLMAVAFAAALSSCGTFKRSTDSSSDVSIKSSDSATASIHKTDSTATDKVTVKEKVDTTVAIEGSHQHGSQSADRLFKGDSIVLDNDDQRVVVKYDPLKSIVTADAKTKPRSARVLIDRETITDKSVNVKREDAAVTQVSHSDMQVKEEKKVDTKVKSGLGIGAWIAISLLICFLILFVYAFIKVKFGRFF